jgi:hypothetical protein
MFQKYLYCSSIVPKNILINQYCPYCSICSMRFSKLAKRNRKTPLLYCNAINHNHFRQAYIFLGTNGTIEQYKYIYI